MSDLDDEELEATRKLNGVAKKSNIEKDIKRCEQLTKPEHANWIGISNQLAIAHVVDRVKELEEENKRLKAKIDVTNWQEKTAYESLKEKYITKQKVKNRIKENKKLIDETYSEDIIQKLTDENEILEELLEDK